MMTTPLTIKADYYFAFGNSDFPHLWDIFTRKGFRHCCAFKWDGFNWLLVDPLGQGLDITILNYTSEDDVPSIFRQAGWTVIRAKTINDKFIFRGLMTCVTVCKQLVGIKACWVVTPWQLYNYIKKEKHMNPFTLPKFNLEWLENKMTLSFGGNKSAPPPAPPKKSEAEVKAEANQERTLRAEESAVKKQQNAGKRRRRGRSLLIAKGNDETGLSDTLG